MIDLKPEKYIEKVHPNSLFFDAGMTCTDISIYVDNLSESLEKGCVYEIEEGLFKYKMIDIQRSLFNNTVVVYYELVDGQLPEEN